MRIAIVETGGPPAQLRGRHPSYPAMMERMLAPVAPALSFQTHEKSALPAFSEFDGVLITGSPAGVYDGHDWIEPLKHFILASAARGKPQVGICFGHQIMAEAFGGTVEKSDKGWGVGLHEYEIVGETSWMTPPQGKIACAVSHQDQVIAPPEGARLLAGSDFCPYGVLGYARGPAISFQMHPEFDAGYAADLVRLRRERLGDTLAEEALASLMKRSDRGLIARWIANFFEGS